MFALAQNATNTTGGLLGELVEDGTLTEDEQDKLMTAYGEHMEVAARLHVLAANFVN